MARYALFVDTGNYLEARRRKRGGGREVPASGEGRRVACEVRSEREGVPDSVGGGQRVGAEHP